MGTLRRLLLVLTSGLIVFLATSTVRASDTTPTSVADRRIVIPVRMIIEGSFQPSTDVLVGAQEEAARIYASIGVSFVWTIERDSESSLESCVLCLMSPAPIVAAVLSGSRTDRFLKGSDLPETVLGVAPHKTRRVYVFWDRILQRAERDEVLADIVLGRVLAHEIGHQLLPAQGHSEDGLMQPSLNFKMAAVPMFTDEEAAAIRLPLTGTPGRSDPPGVPAGAD